MWPSVGVLPSGRYVPYWHCTHCSRKSKLSSMDVSLPLSPTIFVSDPFWYPFSCTAECSQRYASRTFRFSPTSLQNGAWDAGRAMFKRMSRKRGAQRCLG